MLKIREIDARIIRSLLLDGRKNFSEIAQECGVTKNKIWKRYKEMKRKGIITGATVSINFASFGYEALATLLISVEAQRINEVMDYVKKIHEIRPYRQYYSIYNIRAVSTLRDLKELDRVKEAIRRHLPANGVKTYIWTDVRNIPENLNLIQTEKSSNRTVRSESKSKFHAQSVYHEIDHLDRQIMEKLSLDGRATFSGIAQKLGTSTDTVSKRYQKLVQNGDLRASIQIDPKKLGFASILDFNIAFSTPVDNTLDIVESLAKIPDVIIITKTSGDYDLQLTAMARDVEHGFVIQEEIAKTCGVTKIEVSARKIPDGWPTPLQYISTF